jgi:hypothetical protein
MTTNTVKEPLVAVPPLHAAALLLALLTVEILPSLPRYFGVVPSLALGTAAAAGVVIFAYLVNWTASFREHVEQHGFVDFTFLACVVIAILIVAPHAAIADSLQSIDIGQFFFSLGLLTLFLGAAAWLSDIVGRKPLLIIGSLGFLILTYPFYLLHLIAASAIVLIVCLRLRETFGANVR